LFLEHISDTRGFESFILRVGFLQEQPNPYDSPTTASPSARRKTKTGCFVKAFGIITFVGFNLCLLSFIYGVFFVGVPYPDAPPGLVQRQAFHLDVSQYIAMGGALMLLSGLMGLVGTAVVYLIVRIAAHDRPRP